MSDQHVEDDQPDAGDRKAPAPPRVVVGAEEPVVGGPNDVVDKIRPGAGKWETGVYLTRHVSGADGVGGRSGNGWDGEGPDHFTELERRLIINLRTCQQWCIRTEDKLSRLMYALGEVIAVLEEIRQEETLGSE